MLIISAVCWGSNVVLGQLAVGNISPMMLVSLRWTSVVILLAIFARKQVARDWDELKKHLPFLFVMGTLGFTGFNALFYSASHLTSGLNIGIVQGAIPVIVLFGSFAVHKTPILLKQLVGISITIIGVTIVISGGDITRLIELAFNLGDVLMILACFLYAAYVVMLKDPPKVSSISLFTAFAVAAFISSLFPLATEFSLGYTQMPTTQGWIVVAVTSLFPSFVAQIFFINATQVIGPSRAGIFMNLVPVIGAILVVTFLKEPLEIFHIIALALVLAGIWIAEKGKSLQSQIPEQ